MQFSVDRASMPTKKLMGLFSFMADPRSDLLAKSSRDLRSKDRPSKSCAKGHHQQAEVRRSGNGCCMQRKLGRYYLQGLCLQYLRRSHAQGVCAVTHRSISRFTTSLLSGKSVAQQRHAPPCVL